VSRTDGRTKLLYQYRVMNEYGRAMKTINTGESRTLGFIGLLSVFLQISFRVRIMVYKSCIQNARGSGYHDAHWWPTSEHHSVSTSTGLKLYWRFSSAECFTQQMECSNDHGTWLCMIFHTSKSIQRACCEMSLVGLVVASDVRAQWTTIKWTRKPGYCWKLRAMLPRTVSV